MASNENNGKKLTKMINSVGIVGGGTMGRGNIFEMLTLLLLSLSFM